MSRRPDAPTLYAWGRRPTAAQSQKPAAYGSARSSSAWQPASLSNQRAARLVRAGMGSILVTDWHIYTRADARKTAPLMLRSVGATEYWGDSDEDEGAALAAGVPSVRVARFV